VLTSLAITITQVMQKWAVLPRSELKFEHRDLFPFGRPELGKILIKVGLVFYSIFGAVFVLLIKVC
jgi:hypothetical protein